MLTTWGGGTDFRKPREIAAPGWARRLRFRSTPDSNKGRRGSCARLDVNMLCNCHGVTRNSGLHVDTSSMCDGRCPSCHAPPAGYNSNHYDRDGYDMYGFDRCVLMLLGGVSDCCVGMSHCCLCIAPLCHTTLPWSCTAEWTQCTHVSNPSTSIQNLVTAALTAPGHPWQFWAGVSRARPGLHLCVRCPRSSGFDRYGYHREGQHKDGYGKHAGAGGQPPRTMSQSGKQCTARPISCTHKFTNSGTLLLATSYQHQCWTRGCRGPGLPGQWS